MGRELGLSGVNVGTSDGLRELGLSGVDVGSSDGFSEGNGVVGGGDEGTGGGR